MCASAASKKGDHGGMIIFDSHHVWFTARTNRHATNNENIGGDSGERAARDIEEEDAAKDEGAAQQHKPNTCVAWPSQTGWSRKQNVGNAVRVQIKKRNH